ncbi:MAG: transposase [Deltaproteobacteria bacterium]|jgi:hypothetical protein|nr:transposase [Deltaproteobacteria bacterium]
MEALAEKGITPGTVIADTAYGSDTNRNKLAEMGAELVSPVSGKNIGTKNNTNNNDSNNDTKNGANNDTNNDTKNDANNDTNSDTKNDTNDEGMAAADVGSGTADERGVEAADGGDASDRPLTLADFKTDADDRITACPLGWKAETRENEAGTGYRAYFDREACNACPKKGKCPVKVGKFKASMGYTSKMLRVSIRRAEQETKEFKDTYRMRSGIEATNSELNSKFGIKHLRYRRLKKVSAAVLLKAICLNISRVVRYRSRKRMASW